MSDDSRGTSLRYSLVVEEDVKKPTKQTCGTHLDEGINVPHSRNVVWYEGFQLVVQLYSLWGVSEISMTNKLIYKVT